MTCWDEKIRKRYLWMYLDEIKVKSIPDKVKIIISMSPGNPVEGVKKMNGF